MRKPTSERPKMTIEEFCEHLKGKGAYIGDDWHIYSKKGKIISRECSNGYYMARTRINGYEYNFMEHRVIWCMVHGSIPSGLQINHKDFNRANNNIENLELMTAKENVNYSIDAGRVHFRKGAESGKAIYTNKDIQAIRWLNGKGWSVKQIQALFGTEQYNTIRRAARGDRYAEVPAEKDVCAVYPTIVNRAQRNRTENALLGMVNSVGELVEMCKFGAVDRNEQISAIGDVIYYLTAFCNEIDIDTTEMLYDMREKCNV